MRFVGQLILSILKPSVVETLASKTLHPEMQTSLYPLLPPGPVAGVTVPSRLSLEGLYSPWVVMGTTSSGYEGYLLQGDRPKAHRPTLPTCRELGQAWSWDILTWSASTSRCLRPLVYCALGSMCSWFRHWVSWEGISCHIFFNGDLRVGP
jgi:hypothetical protein